MCTVVDARQLEYLALELTEARFFNQALEHVLHTRRQAGRQNIMEQIHIIKTS